LSTCSTYPGGEKALPSEGSASTAPNAATAGDEQQQRRPEEVAPLAPDRLGKPRRKNSRTFQKG
jgi:hypothetical protein